MLTDFENLSLLETAINYLQNEYNTSRHLLETSLYYYVKHRSSKNAFAVPIFDDLKIGL